MKIPFEEIINSINKALWGAPVVILMLFSGVYFTIKTGFFQFTHFGKILRTTILSKRKSLDEEKGTPPFQAFCTSLAATVGTGSVTGVSAALAVGGPGAIFWMWISAFLGMMTAFGENVLGGLYRQKSKNGEYGGAMYYMEKGLGSRKLGCFFALCCVLASFGMGNMSQSNAISHALSQYDINPVLVGIILSLTVGAWVLGKLGKINRLCEKFVPFMAGFYILGCLVVIICNSDSILSVFSLIFKEAFNFRSAVGGGLGGVIITGFCRGIFSNEAGLGTTVSIHASSQVKKPSELGMWAIFEVFVDTIIICTLTALVMLLTEKVEISGAFSTVFGNFGKVFVTVSIVLFAFGTIAGWSVIGLDAWSYLTGKSKRVYNILYIFCVYLGSVFSADIVWGLSDMFNGLMIIPNLTAIFLLRKEIINEYKKINP